MGRIEKTVFLSYRRTNAPWVLAISQNLTNHGYDVFFDFNGIAGGDFESVILENIRARAHFIVLLTPSALERCSEPGDWLRREIETALEIKRNVVALMLEGFSFDTPSISSQLTGMLVPLKKYNALPVPVEFFAEAMDRLRTKFLNVPLEAVLHPASPAAVEAVRIEQAAASAAPAVTERELTAQEWYERGFNATDPNERMRFYNEAIRLEYDNDSFHDRRKAPRARNNLDAALQVYDEAIHLMPDNAEARFYRGIVRSAKGDLKGAIHDFDEAIALKSDFAEAFNNRGRARYDRGADLDRTIRDYNEAIRLKPDYSQSFNNRGIARADRGDWEGALSDYNEAIRLKPDYADAFYNRAQIWEEIDKPADAVAAYQKYLDLGGGVRNGDSEEVERIIGKLKKKL
jgi:tetratricopeptide (TPR) repeat protein